MYRHLMMQRDIFSIERLISKILKGDFTVHPLGTKIVILNL